ncbi:cardiotrophin-2-like [Mustelus asterias]
MEVLSRARFAGVATRSVTRKLSLIIHKTHQLIQELDHRSPKLVHLYRQSQGPPFNRAGFQPASLPLPGLPEETHGEQEEEEGEGKEGTWLSSNHRAYAGLAHYLGRVLEDQRELNPGRRPLLDELAYFAVTVGGLTVNLEGLVSGLERHQPGIEAYRQAWGSTGASDWDRKVAGLEVCTRCARWFRASREDFARLASRYS